jgi:hypothetical protein
MGHFCVNAPLFLLCCSSENGLEINIAEVCWLKFREP